MDIVKRRYAWHAGLRDGVALAHEAATAALPGFISTSGLSEQCSPCRVAGELVHPSNGGTV